jgi:hypothetical protein
LCSEKILSSFPKQIHGSEETGRNEQEPNKDVDRRRYQAEANKGYLPGSNLASFN